MIIGPCGCASRASMPLHVDDRRLGAALDRAVRGHHELLALVVGASVARRLDPHPLLRALHLLLVEDEADVAFPVQRREREHRQQCAGAGVEGS